MSDDEDKNNIDDEDYNLDDEVVYQIRSQLRISITILIYATWQALATVSDRKSVCDLSGDSTGFMHDMKIQSGEPVFQGL